MNTLIFGNCLDELAKLEANAFDLVLLDLPYGKTKNHWDKKIALELLWPQLRRVGHAKTVFAFTCAQPFTTEVIVSNPKLFLYEWHWDKVNRSSGFMNASQRPIRVVEDVIIFGKPGSVYNPQMTAGHSTFSASMGANSASYGKQRNAGMTHNTGTRYPTNLISIPMEFQPRGKGGRIPTQKPVALFEYLIRTYTNPGDRVLDPTMGAGTSGVAAANTGRGYCGLENFKPHFELAAQRIARATVKGPTL